VLRRSSARQPVGRRMPVGRGVSNGLSERGSPRHRWCLVWCEVHEVLKKERAKPEEGAVVDRKRAPGEVAACRDVS